MISDYKFQDLAKFVEDLKFLLARGGGMSDIIQSQFAGKSLPQIILKIIWLFLLWVFIIILIYMVYQIIFKGYPRFPLDLVRLKFYNKVDVTKAVGGVNGLLYSSINDLKEPTLIQAMDFYNNETASEDYTTVFADVVSIIENQYQPVYKSAMVDAALSEYYMFFHRIVAAGGREGVDKLRYIQYIIDNYLQLGQTPFTVDKINYNITGKDTQTDKDKITVATNELFLMGDSKVVAGQVIQYTTDPVKMKAILANIASIQLIQPYYLTLLENDQKLSCMFNDGRTSQQRNAKATMRTQYETFIRSFEEYANIKRITTNKAFASFFVDPDYKLACGGNRTKMIEDYKKAKDFNGKKKTLQKAERNEKNLTHKIRLAAGLKNEKKKLMQRRTNAKKLISDVKTQMVIIQREAEDAADAKLMAMRPQLLKPNPDPEDIISYSANDENYPDVTSLSEVQSANMVYFTVFVPGYDIYKEYLNIHRETMLQRHSKDMTDDEIIAFLFLQDLVNMTINRQDVDANKPVIIQRLIKLHLALDKLAGAVKKAVSPSQADMVQTNNEQPTSSLCADTNISLSRIMHHYVFEDESSTKDAITELMVDKDGFDAAYVSNNFSMIKSTKDYTFYLFEILTALHIKDRKGLYAWYAQQYNNLATKHRFVTGTVLDRYLITTFLNLPRAMQDKPDVLEKFKLNKEIIAFVRRRPIFTLLHFNLHEDTSTPPDVLYNAVMNKISSIMGPSFEAFLMLNEREKMTAEKVKLVWKAFETRVFDIRKAHLRMHLINLYLSHYRDSLVVTDPVTQFQVSRQGLVDIYEDQHISYQFGDFFQRLFKPFKAEFIDGRIKTTWRKAFLPARFNSNLKEDIKGISYWREFNAFWIDYMGPKMDGMVKSWWNNFKNFTKPKWQK